MSECCKGLAPKSECACELTEIDRLRAELAEAKESLRLSAQGLHTYVEALNAGNAALAAKDARIATLEAAGNRLGDAAVDGVLTSIEAVTELAEAKARIAEVLATDAKRVDEYNTLLGVIAAANARIAELETERAKLSSFHDMLTKLSHAIARAEKAEARIAEQDRDIAAKARNLTHLNARAERAEAEREALRERIAKALGDAESDRRTGLAVAHNFIPDWQHGRWEAVKEARAALAPSPAGQEE